VEFFRRRFAVPPEKGGWIWLAGPLAIGVAAAGALRPALAAVVVGALAAFCIRQPLTLSIKSYRSTTHAGDRQPAAFWVVAYGLACVLAALALAANGNVRVVALAVPAIPVFVWHFALVARGSERRQVLRDVLAAFALAMAGTAAYWSCGGDDDATAALVWLLPGLQSGASVVHMLLRLEQRRWEKAGPLTRRLRVGIGPAVYHSANVAIAALLYTGGYVSFATVAAFAVCLAEGLYAVFVPQVGHTPKRLGMRQLAVSVVFAGLLCTGWRR